MHKKIFTPFILVLALFGILSTASAQRNLLRLRNGTVAFSAKPPQQWLDSVRSKGVNGPILVVVQLAGDVNATSVTQQGISLKDPLGNGYYTALLDGKAATVPTAITGIAPMPSAMKWMGSDAVANTKSSVDLLVTCYNEISKQQLSALIKSMGGELRSSPLAAYGAYEVSLPGDKILSLAGNPYVKAISNSAKDQPLNREAQRATKVNVLHTPQALGGYGLLGDSISIGVGDNNSGMYHVDTRDRVVNFNPIAQSNHGQHVNGTVGGAGTMDPAAEGFAPHVRLLDHEYNLVWARTGTMQQDYGMSVTNNSYASVVANCSFAGTYDAYAQVLDSITRNYPNVLHVFAAGNDGNLTCGPYPPGYATVTGGYQPAKNVLVVGNVTRRYVPFFNSSRGPTKDGRIKPDMVTTGSDVFSCTVGDGYTTAGATSFSSPQVAGTAGLMQQRYKQLNAGAYPPSDVLKCLLLNGAMDIGNPGPDYINGFGTLNGLRSMVMMENNRYFANTITANNAQTTNITVPANTTQLKVMLYWHDVPASPIAAAQLVNDLDLEVTEPNNTLHQPLIINPSPSQVTANAVEGVDHLNNVEQVVINNPAAGSYAVKVKSGSIAGTNQRYVVSYDFVQDGVQLTFPNTGAIMRAGDSLRIYWDASPGTQAFTVELSTNGGGAWTNIGTAPADDRFFVSVVPNVSSEQCRLRITRGSQQSMSGNFIINPQPALSLSAIQCPGYMNIQWTAVPNATGYQVLRKKGAFLQPEATVTGTSYSIGGLYPDSLYYVAVQPLINGVPGYRSTGVKRIPNDGTCAGSFSDGDLSITAIVAPVSGRQSTSTQLSANETMVLRVRNNDDVAANNYRISYRINGGAWQSAIFTTPIPAAGVGTVSVPGLNLSAVGTYTITAAITNLALTDPLKSNDTVTRTVRQIANPVVNLTTGFTDDFEANGVFTLLQDSIAVTANDKWDYFNSIDSGRLRTFVTSDVLISGNRSISMDAIQKLPPVTNFFTGTFNTTGYTTAANEVRFQFDYKLQGQTRYHDSNAVWVRGNDTQPWNLLLRYDTTVIPGDVVRSGSLSITDALLASSQNFSSSMQIRFGQRDTSVIALNDYGNGVTLDNVKLYLVQNDVAVTDVISPAGTACNMTANTPLTVKVYNGVTQTLTGIQISYQLDGGTVVTETLGTLAGKTSQNYTFVQKLNVATAGLHTLKIWVSAPGDTYHENDTIANYTFRNEPLIASFPYLQNFESGDGYFYAEGSNSSWQYGTPASAGVRNAASGTKAWKTNLTGNYNDNELSYLYSPCFDISGLSNPALSFSAVVNIEDCGSTLCDAAWVEYSVDGGAAWSKLGLYKQGYAWYTDSARNIWKTQDNNRWHVASIPLPTASSLRLRWVLASDPGTGLEGLAIDDVHIYDKHNPVYEGGDTGPITANTGGGTWNSFVKNGGIVAETNSPASPPISTEGQLYNHTKLIDSSVNKYFAPRSYTLKPATALTDSAMVRLYIPDSEILIYLADTTCPTCSRAADAYRLGVLKYDDRDKNVENGIMSDNKYGIYNFIPYTSVSWVPYDRGYYAQIKVASLSELWFYDSGPTIPVPPASTAVVFTAKKVSDANVLAEWTSIIDTLVSDYDLERSNDGTSFSDIYSVNGAQRPSPAKFSYVDTPQVSIGSSVYYRLRWRLLDGSLFYSKIYKIDWTSPNTVNAIFPNPTHDGTLHLQWSANSGTVLHAVVTDVSGKLVNDAAFQATDWNNESIINLGANAHGMYFLRCSVGSNNYTRKIMFQ